MSNVISVTSGVPQGSHVGLKHCKVFIYDLVESIENSKFLLFTNDIKLFQEYSEIRWRWVVAAWFIWGF